MIKIANRFALNIILIITLTYFSLMTGWFASYSNYFFFPVIYQLEDVHGHVLEYAPKNTEDRDDFVFVAPSKQLKIFGEIMRSVDSEGEGLSDITYPVKGGQKKFLTTDEIVHLQDISDLISRLKSLGSLMAVAGVIVIGVIGYRRILPYYMTTLIWYFAALSGAFWLWVQKYGVVEVYSKFHGLILPVDHKCMFSYEESLLRTFLKTPDVLMDFAILMFFLSAGAFVVYYKMTQAVISLIRNKSRL